MHDGEKVVEIKPGPLVSVKTTSKSYQAKNLVITAGPWTNQLLRPLGIELPLQVRGAGKETLESDGLKFESWICHLPVDNFGQIRSPH